MPRKSRSSNLETASARAKLAIQKKPHWHRLHRGASLGYRRGKGVGSWSLRASDGHGHEWLRKIAMADDHQAANGRDILDFEQAVTKARELACKSDGSENLDKPISLDQCLTAYRLDLVARGASKHNAEHVRLHLPAALLSKPVALISVHELKAWRDGLASAGRLKISSVNRICKSLRAALAMFAKGRAAIWRELKLLPAAETARNVILPDGKVLEFVAASYAHNAALGLLVATLAETGTRPSQATRLRCDDLITGAKPKLMMPKSGKGRAGVTKKFERISVPVSVALAARLQRAAAGRALDAPLLLRDDGRPWSERPSSDYRVSVREIVASIGFNSQTTTIYCLRHSSIVRQLLRGTPIRLVAALHDTSVAMVEKHYSKFIDQFADDAARRGLLEAPTDNVVVLARAAS